MTLCTVMPNKNDFWITFCFERSRPLSLPFLEINKNCPYFRGWRTEVTFLPRVTCPGTLTALGELAALLAPGRTPPPSPVMQGARSGISRCC